MQLGGFSRFYVYIALVFTCFASEKCSSEWKGVGRLQGIVSARNLERNLDDLISNMKYFRTDLRDYLRSMKKSHNSKKLTTGKLQRVSDMSDMEGFKRNRLQPLLKVRVSGTEANREVQEFLKLFMQNLGWTIEEDRFNDTTPLGVREFNNIIATQDPSAMRQLVIACHFDSKYFKKITFIGAIDSAVPCAMMLDAAYLLNNSLWEEKSRMAKDVSLQYIFFDGEEAFKDWTNTDSLYGSRHLAEKWAKEQHKHDPEANRLKGIDVFMLLDLLGTSNPTFLSWFENSQHLFDRITKIEKRLEDINAFEGHTQSYFSKTKGYEFSGGIEDDHKPFEEYGLCILHVIPTPFPSVWHKASDKESSLSYQTIDNLNKILRVFIAEYLWLSAA